MKNLILTERNYQKWASFHNVYEWEDVFSDVLHMKVHNYYNGRFITPRRLLRKAVFRQNIVKPGFSYQDKEPLKFKWIISARGYREFTGRNVIPVFIDFPVDIADEIIKATERLPFFFVSMLDIKRILDEKGCGNVHYLPMSIADKWYTGKCPLKNIDVVQVGRRNRVLHRYMLDYVKRNRYVNYVFAANDQFEYYSTLEKRNIGKFETREEFMDLLGRSKISLVSTPGADGVSRFGNIDFVPVRFYECASRYCHMVGRYSDNEEIRILNISSVCSNVKTQKEFDNAITENLSRDCNDNVAKYASFLTDHVTSKRTDAFRKVILEREQLCI